MLTVDKFGRVVIPQEVREALRLRPGTKLAVGLQTDDKIFLKVVEEEPEIVVRKGWPVIMGKGPPIDLDVKRMIRDIYEERSRRHAGVNK